MGADPYTSDTAEGCSNSDRVHTPLEEKVPDKHRLVLSGKKELSSSTLSKGTHFAKISTGQKKIRESRAARFSLRLERKLKVPVQIKREQNDLMEKVAVSGF